MINLGFILVQSTELCLRKLLIVIAFKNLKKDDAELHWKCWRKFKILLFSWRNDVLEKELVMQPSLFTINIPTQPIKKGFSPIYRAFKNPHHLLSLTFIFLEFFGLLPFILQLQLSPPHNLRQQVSEAQRTAQRPAPQHATTKPGPLREASTKLLPQTYNKKAPKKVLCSLV